MSSMPASSNRVITAASSASRLKQLLYAAAETIDVWRGAHGCVYLFDPRGAGPFNTSHASSRTPAHLPALICANFSDVGGTAEVAWDGWGRRARRWHAPAASSSARAVRALLQGLDLIHAFLNLPYLLAKREALAVAQRVVDEKLSASEAMLRQLADGQRDGSSSRCPSQSPLQPPISATSTPAKKLPPAHATAALAADSRRRRRRCQSSRRLGTPGSSSNTTATDHSCTRSLSSLVCACPRRFILW